MFTRRITGLRDEILLDIKEEAVIVVLHFAQFQKVEASVMALLCVQIDGDVSLCRFQNHAHRKTKSIQQTVHTNFEKGLITGAAAAAGAAGRGNVLLGRFLGGFLGGLLVLRLRGRVRRGGGGSGAHGLLGRFLRGFLVFGL